MLVNFTSFLLQVLLELSPVLSGSIMAFAKIFFEILKRIIEILLRSF